MLFILWQGPPFLPAGVMTTHVSLSLSSPPLAGREHNWCYYIIFYCWATIELVKCVKLLRLSRARSIKPWWQRIFKFYYLISNSGSYIKCTKIIKKILGAPLSKIIFLSVVHIAFSPLFWRCGAIIHICWFDCNDVLTHGDVCLGWYLLQMNKSRRHKPDVTNVISN